MFDAFLTLLIGLRSHRFSGLAETRSAYAHSAGSGPVLLCAPHVSLWDGLLLVWVFSQPRSPAVVLDPGSFSNGFLGWCFRRWRGAIVVRQGGGPAGAGRVRRECGRRLAAGEPILIFPTGTLGGGPSYLAGALAVDFPDLPIAVLGLSYDPPPKAWALPDRGARIELSWRLHRPETTAKGLRGLWDRAASIRQALEAAPC